MAKVTIYGTPGTCDQMWQKHSAMADVTSVAAVTRYGRENQLWQKKPPVTEAPTIRAVTNYGRNTRPKGRPEVGEAGSGCFGHGVGLAAIQGVSVPENSSRSWKLCLNLKGNCGRKLKLVVSSTNECLCQPPK